MIRPLLIGFGMFVAIAGSSRGLQAAEADAPWSSWRGPRSDGHYRAALPVEWSAPDVVWQTPLPGRGQSSPVVWEDRIFLTAALDEGRERVVLGLDRDSGQILWKRAAWAGEPEPSHVMNGWASATCATDGTHVVAFFGRGGLHCYGIDGQHLWTRDLGTFEGPWGTAGCPLLVGDRVIQNGDSEKNAFIIAVDIHTGETIWRTERPENRGWSSPVLIEAALDDGSKRKEIVMNGHDGVRAYDPETGRELWYCKSFNGRGTPTVNYAHGLLYVVNGLAGDVYAIRPGGSGDVTDTRMAWHTPRRAGRDLPSPLVVGDYLFVCSMSGIANCYDAKTGEEFEKIRLRGKFSASPIEAGGLVYLPSEAGEVYVLRPGEQIEIVAANAVGASPEEIFRSSVTPDGGEVLLRSDRALYFIGASAE